MENRIAWAAAALTTLLSCACGPPAPTPVPSPPPSSGVYAPDLAQVADAIVGELRAAGIDAFADGRLPSEPFSVGAQRVLIATNPGEHVRLYVYRTSELAGDEASRLTADGNVAPPPGQPPRSHVTWAIRQHFHHRDRVIAAYGGCDTQVAAAMETVFGPALVVVTGVIACAGGGTAGAPISMLSSDR